MKYEITILNWDKYQREMKGGENRRRSRDWIALSTDLLHDPDFVELTTEQRWLWIAMLLHAGRVGPAYKLSLSSARLLFKLRASWRGLVDFEALRNQGFIDLRTDTKQDITVQDIHIQKKAPKKANKKASTKKKKYSKTVPEDWSLSDKGRQLARDLGMSDPEIENQLANFRDHEYPSAKTDFDACWRTWARNRADWNRGKSSQEPSRHRQL